MKLRRRHRSRAPDLHAKAGEAVTSLEEELEDLRDAAVELRDAAVELLREEAARDA